MIGSLRVADHTTTIQFAANVSPPLTERDARFELSGLRLDMFGQPLTDSWFPGGDVEKRPPVTAAGAHVWPAMANAETNGETENARNVGQLGTWGNGDAVNKLPGKRCEGRNWLPERDSSRDGNGPCRREGLQTIANRYNSAPG